MHPIDFHMTSDGELSATLEQQFTLFEVGISELFLAIHRLLWMAIYSTSACYFQLYRFFSRSH